MYYILGDNRQARAFGPISYEQVTMSGSPTHLTLKTPAARSAPVVASTDRGRGKPPSPGAKGASPRSKPVTRHDPPNSHRTRSREKPPPAAVTKQPSFKRREDELDEAQQMIRQLVLESEALKRKAEEAQKEATAQRSEVEQLQSQVVEFKEAFKEEIKKTKRAEAGAAAAEEAKARAERRAAEAAAAAAAAAEGQDRGKVRFDLQAEREEEKKRAQLQSQGSRKRSIAPRPTMTRRISLAVGAVPVPEDQARDLHRRVAAA